MPASSSSSIDIAGFGVERVLGEGPRGVVYEATQAGLERRVALKIYRPDPALADRFHTLRWPEHPHVVGLYAAGESEHGFFTATRLVRGPTLAQLAASGRLQPLRAAELCDEVRSALDAAHAAGIVHGAVTASNVLVDRDGRALLTDFVPPDDATAASDMAALARLRADLAAAADGANITAGRRWVRAAIALLLVTVAGGVALATRSGDPDRPPAPPRPAPGVRPLGSSLTAAAIHSVDCNGQPPSGSSPACTVMQTRLPGRALIVPRDGAIRGWVVRGARGDVALVVIRRQGDGFVVTASSQYQHVADEGVHRLSADLAVHRGERIGVEIAPEASIGAVPATPGAATQRFIGPLRSDPRTPNRNLTTRLNDELVVRADYVPGAKPPEPHVLTGRAAAHAPSGRVLARHDVETAGQVRTITLVSLAHGIVLDLSAGKHRLTRVTIPDADPRGRLVEIDANSFPQPDVIWRNPNGAFVEHTYTVTPASLIPRD